MPICRRRRRRGTLAFALLVSGLTAVGVACALHEVASPAPSAFSSPVRVTASSPAAPASSPAARTTGPVPSLGAPNVGESGSDQQPATPADDGSGADRRLGPAPWFDEGAGPSASPPVALLPASGSVAWLRSSVGRPLEACGPPLAPDRAHALVLQVAILMYHRVQWPALARDALPPLVVSPDRFAAQLAALARAGWRTITVADLARDLADGVLPGPRTLAITFDDGYADGYTVALPILRRFGDVATFYVVTGRLGEPDHLTAAQVTALAAAGMEIGDHSVSHLDLSRLSPDQLRDQVEQSADRIRSLTGSAPVTFAYPYGACSPAVVAELQRDGFLLAVTNREGAREAWPWRYAVPRIRVGPSTTPAGLLARLAPYR